MEELKSFLLDSNNFALILSSIVSISATVSSVIIAVHQSRSQYREKAMALYFETQCNAYMELYKAASGLEIDLKPRETRDIRRLISAAKNAEIVSPHHVAVFIDDFCAVYTEYLEKCDAGKVSDEDVEDVKESLKTMSIYLREELLKYDFLDKRAKRRRKKLESLYYKTIDK